MTECIDIYSRLIIATITFVGPIIILLLSTFNEGERRRKDLAKQTEDAISNLAAQELQDNPSNIRETINRTSEEYRKIEKKTNKELGRLKPIKQFWLIYGSLASSLFLLTFRFLIKDDFCGLKNHNLSIFILILSVLSYIASLFFIIRVFYTIIETKKIIDSK